MTRGVAFFPKIPKNQSEDQRRVWGYPETTEADVPIIGPLTYDQWFQGRNQTRKYDQQTDIFDHTNAYHVPVFGPLTKTQYDEHVARKLQEEWNHITNIYQSTIKSINRTGGWKIKTEVKRFLVSGDTTLWCGICEEYHDHYFCKLLLKRQRITCFRCNKFGHWSPNCDTQF